MDTAKLHTNLKLHANLKWDTLITRANKNAKYEKYRDDGYGSIYEYSHELRAYLFLMKQYNSKYEKYRDNGYGSIYEYSREQRAYLFLMKQYNSKQEFVEYAS